jgi:hypothetical protein
MGLRIFSLQLVQEFTSLERPHRVIMALAAIYSLFIINKSGGLIYYKVYSSIPCYTLSSLPTAVI